MVYHTKIIKNSHYVPDLSVRISLRGFCYQLTDVTYASLILLSILIYVEPPGHMAAWLHHPTWYVVHALSVMENANLDLIFEHFGRIEHKRNCNNKGRWQTAVVFCHSSRQSLSGDDEQGQQIMDVRAIARPTFFMLPLNHVNYSVTVMWQSIGRKYLLYLFSGDQGSWHTVCTFSQSQTYL